MYVLHPSADLQHLFRAKPYQGADPTTAKFLFVGLDANYHASLQHSDSYADVLAYHADGVAFWKAHGIHHPFLKPSYRGDGRRYHQSFARIGFAPDHATQISFVELLHLPTVGRNKLDAMRDLDPAHLRWLNSVIFEGAASHIFVSANVARLMRASAAFPSLSKEPSGLGLLPTLYKDEARSVYLHLHFSNYGKFQRRLEEERLAIAAMIA